MSFKRLLWLAFVLPVGMALADLPPLPGGLPPQTRLEPPVDIGSRMLGLAASPDGLLHIAHSLGVHSYDGRRWQGWPSPNGLILRVLAHDGRDTLYTGGEESFGFLRADVAGNLVYTDLAAQADSLLGGESFDQIWEILVSPDGVFFNANHHLFRYRPDDDSLELWRHQDRFGAQALVDGQVVVQFRGLGLKAFNGADFHLLPGGEAFATQAYHLLPLPEGGLLALQRDGRFLHWRDGQVEA